MKERTQYLIAIAVGVLGFGLMVAVTRADPLNIPDQKFYDSRGNHVGTTSRDSAGNERYYDGRGNVTGTSSPIYGGRNYYDPRGNHVGTSSDPFSRDWKR